MPALAPDRTTACAYVFSFLLLDPKIGAIKHVKFRQSVHSNIHATLRKFWLEQRNKLGLSQRTLAKKLQVAPPLICNIKTGDICLDIVEVIKYCKALEVYPHQVIDLLVQLDKEKF